MIAHSVRIHLLLFTVLACLLAARTAAAQQRCTNDIDCPNPACGGEICDWLDTTNPMTCKPAGSYPKGEDGWCTRDDDCKCKGLGATCDIAICTFTRPCEVDGGTCAAGGSGGSGGGGSGGSGGGGSTGSAGTSSTGSAGTSSGGSTGSAGTGGGGGGCSVAGRAAGGWSVLVAAIGLVALRARRRR